MQLLDGEEIVWSGRPSWRSMLAFYIKWMLVAIAIGLAAQLLDSFTSINAHPWWFWLVTVVLILLTLVGGWLKRLDTHYIVTNQRINIRHGIFSRADHATSYERLQNVKTYQNLIQRLLGVGLVDFDTAAGDDFDFKFVGINDPAGLARQIAELQRTAMQGHSQPHTQRRRLRTGFECRMAFGGLESPALCRSRADEDAGAGGWARDRRPAATPGSLKEPSDPGGFAGVAPGSRKGCNGSSSRDPLPLARPPDHTRDS